MPLPEPEPARPPNTQGWVDDRGKDDLEAIKPSQSQLNETKKTLTDTEKSLKDEQNATASLRDILEQRDLTITTLQDQVKVLQLVQDKVTEMNSQMTSLGTTVALALSASKDPETAVKLTPLQELVSSISEMNYHVTRVRAELGAGSISDINNNVQSLSNKLGNISLLPDILNRLKAQQENVTSVSEQRVRRYGTMIPKSSTTPTNLIARYDCSYSSPPRFLFALSEVRGSSGPSDRIPPSWYTSTEAACTIDSAEIIAPIDVFSGSQIEWLEYNWMTSPSGVIKDSAGWDFDRLISDGERDSSATESFTFGKPYNRIPRVAVWWTTLSWRGVSVRNARVRVSAEAITTSGFNVRVETWGGSSHEGGRIMWCAWDSDDDGIKVISETKSWGSKEQASPGQGGVKCWPLDFKGKTPKAILTGIQALDVDVSETAAKMNLECKLVGPLAPNSIIRYGTDSGTKARWLECMYVAIIED